MYLRLYLQQYLTGAVFTYDLCLLRRVYAKVRSFIRESISTLTVDNSYECTVRNF